MAREGAGGAKRPGAPARRGLDIVLVAAALAASVGLVHLVGEDAALTAAFAGGLVVLALAGWLAGRTLAAPAPESAEALPDWSVTLAAIEQQGVAVAIGDRANRLVCANARFEAAFGTAHAPPQLALSQPAVDLLVQIARTAWREGRSEPLTVRDGQRSWVVEALRVGTGQAHLMWRLEPVVASEPFAFVAGELTGPLGQALDAAGIAAALVDPEGTIRAVNPAMARRAAGDEAASLAGADFASLIGSDDREQIHFVREGRAGTPQTLVTVPLALAGGGENARPASAGEVPALMLLIDAGAVLGGWRSDAGGETAQLEALLERLPLGLAITDRDGRFRFANPAFRRAAGIAEGAMPPFPSDLVIPRDKTAIVDAVRRFAQGPAAGGDIAVRLRNQPDEPISLGLAGIRGLGPAAVLLSLADTTEETQLRRQVAQATKMQAIGQLAGGVAHDFNNLLTAIIGHCDLMLLRHMPGDSDYDDIQQVRANSYRAASLTRQLLAFSRQQTLQPEIIQLPDLLTETSQMLKRLLGARITLRVQHDRDLGPVRADPRQLEQVIINLAVNARDAIQTHGGGESASGTLSFSTRRIEAQDVRRMGSEIIPAGEYTALIAEDTGGGIDPAVLPKVFEPFFTTKEQGKGTGLGLSTVYGIVKQSGGFIFASNVSAPGGGTAGARFTIYLPVHHPSPDDLRRPEAVELVRDWGKGGTILLVEDEDMVRAVAERALVRHGYDVVTAADGEEGLEAARTRGPFDLVVTDVVMPGLDGPAMAREIRQFAPGLPVLFMSGYAEAQLRDQIDIAQMHFIAKPFSVAEISDKVRDVLALTRRPD